MNIRKATENDIRQIASIYSAIHTEEEKGRAVIGWKRNIYPVEGNARDAVHRGDLFVMEEEGEIVASAIINQIQVPEYADCPWKYRAADTEVMVLHTLVVSPDKKGHGYGTAFVDFYEQYAKEHHCPFLRMDTNVINHAARKLYARLGYSEPGIVHCVFNGIAGVQLVCLEKRIDL